MSIPVAESNAESFKAWNGADGEHWASYADHYEGSATELRTKIIAAARVEPGMRVLEVGCGNGRTAREMAARVRPDGRVVGLDLSAPMLEVARRRAADEGVENVEFRQGDAQVYEFSERFDVVVSQFGSMFFGDRDAAFRNLRGALAPGGRLALLTWQPIDRNEWASSIRAALRAGGDVPEPPADAPTPWSFGDPDVLTSVLTGAGFRDVEVAPVDATFRAGGDAAEALAFVQTTGVVRGTLAGFDEAGAARAREALEAKMREHESSDGVVFRSAAWLTTATA